MSQALMEALGEEQRNALIQKAIENLMTPAKDNYGRATTTALEDAFSFAVQQTAREIINKELTNDDGFKAKIRAVIVDATDKFLVENREATVNELSNSLSQSVKFSASRY